MSFLTLRPSRAARGFTLIEMLAVLIIIALLGTLVARNVLPLLADARVKAAQYDVNQLMNALKEYNINNQTFPTAEQGLQALIAKPTTDPVPPNWHPYLEKLPNDPWGHPYQYLNPGIKNQVDVMSYGPGGPGSANSGDGKNTEIGSWQ